MPKYRITNAKDHNLRHGQQIHIPVDRGKGKEDGSHFVTVVDPGIQFAPVASDGGTSLPTESDVKHVTCSEKHAEALGEQGYELEKDDDEDDTSQPASSASAATPFEEPTPETTQRDPFETPEDRDLKKQQQRNAKLQATASAEEQQLRAAAADREALIAENRELATKGEQQAATVPSKEDVLKEQRRKG